MADKPSYLSKRPQVDPKLIRARTRKQWEALLAVDQLVGRLVDVLTDAQRIDDTIFIFTSDNGFLNQEHRWRGKDVPYEESIRVPMVIAYPREIPPASVTNALASNVDLAPTIADFAGVALPADGVSLRPLLTDHASSARDSVVLEHAVRTAPAYCGVRTPGFMFARYATGEEELYDLAADPHQLDNVAASRPNKTTELRSLTQTLCAPVPPGFSWDAVPTGAG
jgi:arylsulfatase A-like enzyme